MIDKVDGLFIYIYLAILDKTQIRRQVGERSPLDVLISCCEEDEVET